MTSKPLKAPLYIARLFCLCDVLDFVCHRFFLTSRLKQVANINYSCSYLRFIWFRFLKLQFENILLLRILNNYRPHTPAYLSQYFQVSIFNLNHHIPLIIHYQPLKSNKSMPIGMCMLQNLFQTQQMAVTVQQRIFLRILPQFAWINVHFSI